MGGTEGKVAVLLDERGRAEEVVAVSVTNSEDPTATDRRNAASAAGVARVERK